MKEQLLVVNGDYFVYWRGAGWYAPVVEGGNVKYYFVVPLDTAGYEASRLSREGNLGTPSRIESVASLGEVTEFYKKLS